jgi:hypothetical protein
MKVGLNELIKKSNTMEEIERIVTHLNTIQDKETFKNVSIERHFKISSHLTVITYRDYDRFIQACNEHVYRVENNITFN